VDPVDEAAIELARSHLPAGVSWINVPAVVIVAGALGWLVAAAAIRVGLGGDAPGNGAPWPRRARWVYPGRLGAKYALGAVPFAGVVFSTSFGGPWAIVSGSALGLLATVAAMLGAVAAGDGLERRIGAPSGLLRRARDVASLALGFFPQVVLAGLACIFANVVDGPARLACVAAGVLGVTVVTLRPLMLIRLCGLLRPAPDGLRSVVEAMAARTRTPLGGGVHLLDWSMANALAYQVPCAVVFTERSIEGLTDEDVAGICAHELAHLREPRWVVAVRTASFVVLALPLLVAPIGPAWMTAALTVASFGSWLMVQRWMQRFETLADAAAGKDEPLAGAYGRALEKLHELNLVPVVM
jgi:Zn-dependent protease with chaperone function